MESYWFGDLDGGISYPVSPDPEILAKRISELATTGMAKMPEWELAQQFGFARDRPEYLKILHITALHLVKVQLGDRLKAGYPELILMVKMLDQIDSVINLLSERAVEWHRALNPEFSRKSGIPCGKELRDLLREGGSVDLIEILDEIDRLVLHRSVLAKKVAEKASDALPNCSAIAGGLVAARLAAEAGSIHRLSMMPASAIQVLGAGNALFSHLSSGSPSPKHGIIYQQRAVHSTSRGRRGKVARTLAAKLAIAARIDYYRGEPDSAFLAMAKVAIRHARWGT